MNPRRSLSSPSSESGVGSRVEACRKRLRTIRAGQKGQTIEPGAGISVACEVETGAETSQSPGVIEAKTERLDEAGIT